MCVTHWLLGALSNARRSHLSMGEGGGGGISRVNRLEEFNLPKVHMPTMNEEPCKTCKQKGRFLIIKFPFFHKLNNYRPIIFWPFMRMKILVNCSTRTFFLGHEQCPTHVQIMNNNEKRNLFNEINHFITVMHFISAYSRPEWPFARPDVSLNVQ